MWRKGGSMGASRMLLVFTVVLSLLLVSCSGEERDLELKSDLAAKVGDAKITIKESEQRFEQLPSKQRDEFKGKRGKAEFVDKLIEEELIYQEAMSEDLQYVPEIKSKLRQAEKSILITEFYNREILGKIDVSEEEIEKYYNENMLEFTTRAIIQAQHMFTADRKKAESWKRRLAEGENFSKIAKEESEDELTALEAGNLGFFNPGGYVKFIGRSDIWSEAVNELESGEISDIIEFEKGYSIVRIQQKTPEKIQQLSEVRKRIVDRLKNFQAREVYKAEIAKLKQKYKPENYVKEEVRAMTRTPEELWEIAQMENDPYERIQYYRDIVNNYPDHKFAPQALFMIAFVYAEELRYGDQAKRTFNELLKNYPDSEVAESARWMLDNMDKPHPPFESLESMKKAMEEQESGQTQ
jgi:EpsD family peptidyl-prolyl cis-trans isomerase